MFQVTAISVATEPVPRIRSVAPRPAPDSAPEVAKRAQAAPPSAFDDPAAVVQIGYQARALARRASEERQVDAPPPPPKAPSLADAARAVAQALWANENGRVGDATQEAEDSQAGSGQESDFATKELSAEERRQIDDLKKQDHKVRAEQQAQKSTGGQFTGAVHYEYRLGPDGRLYAVQGSVSLDVAPVSGDPEATLRKMESVGRAALAPSQPSIADRQVAVQAARLAQSARAELATRRYSEAKGGELQEVESSAPEAQPTSAELESAEVRERALYANLRLVA